MRRSILFLPASDAHKIQKAATISADALAFDLEDAIAWDQKEAARTTFAQVFPQTSFHGQECLVRINDVRSNWWKADLASVLPLQPHGIILPKTESAEDIQMVSQQLEEAEINMQLPPHTFKLLVVLESAKGVLNAGAIAAMADVFPRLEALIFGGEDYAASVGATRTPDSTELLYARSAVVCAAAAYRMAAIDTVYVDFKDDAGLAKETLKIKHLGFSGKLAIHPQQVSCIQSVLSPTEVERQEAEALIAAFEAHERAGQGVFAFRGKMVDMPLVIQAKRILAAKEDFKAKRTKPLE